MPKYVIVRLGCQQTRGVVTISSPSGGQIAVVRRLPFSSLRAFAGLLYRVPGGWPQRGWSPDGTTRIEMSYKAWYDERERVIRLRPPHDPAGDGRPREIRVSRDSKSANYNRRLFIYLFDRLEDAGKLPVGISA